MCKEALEFECEMSRETSAESLASIRDFSVDAERLLGVSSGLLGPARSRKPEHCAGATRSEQGLEVQPLMMALCKLALKKERWS